ncbi:MAG: diguanylate cyclase [Deltaproteobacteria bacterium]|nr:diguanylate cyclase [Deltaproteobacteria bacterium]
MEDKHIKVLAIQDEPKMTAAIRRTLLREKSPSFDIELADRLSSGLERLSGGGIDIVLLDLMLPGSQRLDTLDRVLAHSTKVPVVVLTALGEEALAVKALQRGAQDYLFKAQLDSNMLMRTMQCAIEPKWADEASHETNLFLQNTLESSSSISIMFTDLEGNILYWNKGAEEIFGYKAEEIVGRHKTNILYPDDEEETKRTVEEVRSFVLKNKQGTSCEIIEIAKDGRKLWINVNITPWLDQNGKVIGILGIGQDTTERKHAEEALRVSEARLKQIIEKNADAIIVVDRDGIVQFVNPAAESLFGREAKNLQGESFGFPMVAGATEIDIVRKDGERATAEMRFVETEWEGKSAFLTSLRDITNRKQMEVSLERANQDLKQSMEESRTANQKILQQQKSVIEEERLKVLLQMAGATAHELNQPLMGLLGNIQLMRLNKDTPEKLAGHMDIVEEAGQRITDIIRKIQDIRHYDTKPYPGGTPIINLDQKLNIFIVEDSVEDFERIETILNTHTGITLSRATTIKDAVQLLDNGHVDLILLDHVLPDGNSLDFLRIMDEKVTGIPVVVITAHGDEMVASQVIQAGAHDYLPKERVSDQSLSRSINNALEKGRLKREIKLAMKKMVEMSTRDDLTGLYNRRYFMEALEREVARAGRYEFEIVLCMADLDHFKRINDTYGHPVGDRVLSEIGRMLKKCFRQSDLVCRYGGEEFAVILPNTRIEEARTVGERFREMVAGYAFEYEEAQFQMTVSIGIAKLDGSESKTPMELVAKADEALYRAKGGGRNRVKVYRS